MLHEEAADTGELVGLRRQDDNIEVEIGEVLPGQLEAGVVGIIDVNDARSPGEGGYVRAGDDERDGFFDALQALRSKGLKTADDASVQIVDALADVANILTPEQRADLADDWEAMHKRWQR